MRYVAESTKDDREPESDVICMKQPNTYQLAGPYASPSYPKSLP